MLFKSKSNCEWLMPNFTACGWCIKSFADLMPRAVISLDSFLPQRSFPAHFNFLQLGSFLISVLVTWRLSPGWFSHSKSVLK